MSKHDRLVSAQLLLQKLHQWRTSLPAHLGSVKPSTLIPSFRRQAVALQLAYSHAIMHATRPFLLGDENAEVSMECISAAKTSLELVDKMAGDSTLFHSFWWTHYVTFCALAVVYVWGIQLVRRPARQADDEFYAKLFDLAERCRAHLRQATAGLSPNRRYDIILEELRREARKSHNNKAGAAELDHEEFQNIEEFDAASLHGPFFNNPNVTTSSNPNFLGIAYNESTTSALGFEGAFQFSDWLTLDSSVRLTTRIGRTSSSANFTQGLFPSG